MKIFALSIAFIIYFPLLLSAESIFKERTVTIHARECSITIEDPDNLTEKPVTLSQPTRIVIDIKFLNRKKSSNFTSPCISKVRFGNHDSFTRIVFDLVSPDAIVEYSKNSKKITITTPKNISAEKRVEELPLPENEGIIDFKKNQSKILTPTFTSTQTPPPTHTSSPTKTPQQTKTPTLQPTKTSLPSPTATTHPTITPIPTQTIKASPSLTPTQTQTFTSTPTITTTKIRSDVSYLSRIDFTQSTPNAIKFIFNKPTDFRLLKASPVLLKIIIDKAIPEGPHVLKPYFAPSTFPSIESIQVQSPQENRVVILITLEKDKNVQVFRSGNSIVVEP